MIPYTTYEEVNLRFDEFNQELGINRISSKMLDNDIAIQSSIETTLSGDIKELRIANKAETRSQSLLTKAIVPEHVMSLSATSNEIRGDTDNRFISNGQYKNYINEKLSPTLWADLSFEGSFVGDVFPSTTTILSTAVGYIGNYDANDGTLMYVRYVYTHHWTTRYRHWTHHHTQHHYRDYLYQDTYKRVNNNWVLQRRRQSNRI